LFVKIQIQLQQFYELLHQIQSCQVQSIVVRFRNPVKCWMSCIWRYKESTNFLHKFIRWNCFYLLKPNWKKQLHLSMEASSSLSWQQIDQYYKSVSTWKLQDLVMMSVSSKCFLRKDSFVVLASTQWHKLIKKSAVSSL